MTTATAGLVGVRPVAAGTGSRAQVDAAVRLLAGSALWLALLTVGYWWVADGGVSDLATPATALTSAGRITGLAASVLLLAQVTLMARVPALEHAFGQDRLAAVHRVVGFTSVNLMIAHIALTTWGYAGGSLVRSVAELWTLTVDYPGMLLAGAGTVALLAVAVTSARAARRRLRYESWHLLHLYAYLGVGLALPHQLWTGQQLTTSTARTVFWWSTWAVAAAAVLVWRVGLPLARNLRHRLQVTSVVREAPGVHSVYLTGRRLDRLPVAAGQFLTWRFLGRPGWTRANPYSLSAAPDGRSLRITVQSVGDGSRDLATLVPGTRVLFEGPFGRLGGRARTQRKVALIGAGVGMAPLRALAEGLPYRPGEAMLVQRDSTAPLFRRELDLIAAERGLRVVRSTGHRRGPDSWWGADVRTPASDADLLRHLLPDLEQYDVFCCGPAVWTDLVVRDLLRCGLPAGQLHVETFGW